MQVRRALLAVAARQPVGRSRNPTEPARSDPDCCFTRARSVSVTIFPARRCAVVFCTRYIDLLWNFASLYNYLLKLLFIGASLTIVYFMRYGPSQKATYNADEDAFPVQCAAAAIAVILHSGGEAHERRWAATPRASGGALVT